jgi:hypothetical protein
MGETAALAAGAAGVIALGAAGWAGCAMAGAGGAATAFSWGGADCANPGEIVSTPARHKAGTHNLDSRAVVR